VLALALAPLALSHGLRRQRTPPPVCADRRQHSVYRNRRTWLFSGAQVAA